MTLRDVIRKHLAIEGYDSLDPRNFIDRQQPYPSCVIEVKKGQYPERSIKCLDCGFRSFSWADVANCYCASCHEFHADKALRKLIATEAGTFTALRMASSLQPPFYPGKVHIVDELHPPFAGISGMLGPCGVGDLPSPRDVIGFYRKDDPLDPFGWIMRQVNPADTLTIDSLRGTLRDFEEKHGERVIHALSAMWRCPMCKEWYGVLTPECFECNISRDGGPK